MSSDNELHDLLYTRYLDGPRFPGYTFDLFLENLLAESWHANKLALEVFGKRKITDKTKRSPGLARELDACLHLVAAIAKIEGRAPRNCTASLRF